MIINYDKVQTYIYKVRGRLVMLDRDISELLAVEIKVLNHLAKLNEQKFPKGSFFKLTSPEWMRLRASNDSFFYDLRKTPPTAYLLESVVMFAFLLKGPKATFLSLGLAESLIKARLFVGALDENEKTVSVDKLKEALLLPLDKKKTRINEFVDIFNSMLGSCKPLCIDDVDDED